MEIRDDEKTYIVTPLSPKIDKRESERIFSNIYNEEEREIAIDFSFVQDCTIEFIETLKKYSSVRKISAFNIPSDIFVLFNFMGMDKFIKLFVSEMDFENNERRLVNRSFRVA